MASPAWEKRNEAARRKGYKNYYDYRVHNYGKSKQKATGARLRMLRGHASTADLKQTLKNARSVVVVGKHSDKSGRWDQFDFLVTDASGDTDMFALRGSQATRGKLKSLVEFMESGNIPFFIDPSLDVFIGG